MSGAVGQTGGHIEAVVALLHVKGLGAVVDGTGGDGQLGIQAHPSHAYQARDSAKQGTLE